VEETFGGGLKKKLDPSASVKHLKKGKRYERKKTIERVREEGESRKGRWGKGGGETKEGKCGGGGGRSRRWVSREGGGYQGQEFWGGQVGQKQRILEVGEARDTQIKGGGGKDSVKKLGGGESPERNCPSGRAGNLNEKMVKING